MISTVMVLKILVIVLSVILLFHITSPIQNSLAIQNILDVSNHCEGSSYDIDGDGLRNEWEEEGIDINNDGVIDLDLPRLGASSSHKDLFLEIDYMQDHKPYSGVADSVIATFRDSPQCNPDGVPGTNLHIEVDDEVPHEPSTDLINETARTQHEYVHFRGLDSIKDQFFGNEDQRTDSNSENILDAKEIVYKYALFIHTFNNKGNSGIARDIPAMDFVVSLGAQNWAPNPDIKHNTGTFTDQTATLLHELGHTINLHHGGGDSYNYKPNYESRMNYHFQLLPIKANTPLDYSRCALNDLNERSLDETVGLKESCPIDLISYTYYECPNVFNPAGTTIPIRTGHPTNWNIDTDEIDKSVKENVNCDADPTRKPAYTLLPSYNDWNNVIYVPSPTNFLSGAISQSDNSYNITDLVSGSNVTNGSSGSNVTNGSSGSNVTNGSSGSNVTNGNIDNTLELLDEPTPRDFQLQALGKIAGIKAFTNNVIPDSSLQVPTLDSEENLIMLNPMGDETLDNATLAREYYNMTLGEPNPIPYTNTEGIFTDEESSETVVDAINQGDIDLAIEKLETNVLDTADSSFGGANSNDFIINPDDQEILNQLVNDAISYLKARSCTYDECNYE
jgi:hypothetical protein